LAAIAGSAAPGRRLVGAQPATAGPTHRPAAGGRGLTAASRLGGRCALERTYELGNRARWYRLRPRTHEAFSAEEAPLPAAVCPRRALCFSVGIATNAVLGPIPVDPAPMPAGPVRRVFETLGSSACSARWPALRGPPEASPYAKRPLSRPVAACCAALGAVPLQKPHRVPRCTLVSPLGRWRA